jgi:hypothetical protein
MSRLTAEQLNMITPVTFFKSIPIEMPRKMILTRLGYRSSKTVLSDRQQDELEETIAEGFARCATQGCWRRIPIIDGEILLQGGAVMRSHSVAKLLKDSIAVVLMAAPVGPAIVAAASDALTRGDGATAVILDAVGAQSAEAAMTWVNEYVRREVCRSGQKRGEGRACHSAG